MKFICSLTLLFIFAANVFATPDYSSFMINIEDANILPYKICKNNNSIFVVGRDKNATEDATATDHDLMILKFKITTDHVQYEAQYHYQDKEDIRLAPNSVIYPNEIGGFNLFTNVYKYEGQFSKYFSFDANGNLNTANIDTVSFYDPLYKNYNTSLLLMDDMSFCDIYVNSNVNTENPYDLVSIKYSSEGDFISQQLFLKTGADSGLLTKDSLIMIIVSHGFLLQSTADAAFVFASDMTYGIGSYATGVKMYQGSLLAKVNDSTELLWSIETASFYDTDSDFLSIHSLTCSEDNKIYVIGEMMSKITHKLEYQVLEIDGSNGALLKKSALFCNQEYMQFNEIHLSQSGEIIVVGNCKTSQNGISKSYISQFNNDLTQEWEVCEVNSDGASYDIQGIIELSEGSYFGYGYILDNNNKSDFLGIEISTLSGIELNTTRTNNVAIKSMNSQIQVDINSPTISDVKIIVSDITGRIYYQTMSTIVNQNTEYINTSGFPTGCYLINVEFESGFVTKKIVL